MMKEMNSLTHSCMHSLASFAILAFSGRAIFMMRATGAKLRILASEAVPQAETFAWLCGGDVEECGEGDDMTLAAGRPFPRHVVDVIRRFDRLRASSDAGWQQSVDVQTGQPNQRRT